MLESLTDVSDSDLIHRLQELVATHNDLTAQVVAHIGEVDARKLYADAACSSMFGYCTTVLGLSESAAYKRIAAARVARTYPVVHDALAEGRLHLTAVAMLKAHLTADNHPQLIEAAAGKSKRELARLLADRAPKPDAPTRIRRQPKRPGGDRPEGGDRAGVQPAATAHSGAAQRGDATRTSELTRSETSGSETPGAQDPPATSPLDDGRATGRVEPLGQQRYKIQFTAPEAWVDRLRQAQDLLSHRVPDGDMVEVLDQALTLLVEQVRGERFAVLKAGGKKERVPPVPTDPGISRSSRHIPNAVKREVFERDGGRCTFVDSQGRRCGETRFIEYHHCLAWAKGGEHSAANVTLRCRCHNGHAARQDFGPAWMGAAHIAARVGVQTSLLGWPGPAG